MGYVMQKSRYLHAHVKHEGAQLLGLVMGQANEHIRQQRLTPPAKQTLKYNQINECLFLIQQVAYFWTRSF